MSDEIVLSSKQLSTIPAWVYESIKTTRLKLDYNALTEVPTQILSLSSLKYLNLRSNSLTVFPIPLTQLNLSILDVSRNKIKELPIDPGNLINLKVFACSRNKISLLPVWISEMSQIKLLKIENNPLRNVPRELLENAAGDDWLDKLKQHLKQSNEELPDQREPLVFKECDHLVHYYLSSTQKPTTNILETANSIAYASSLLYRTLKTCLLSIPDRNLIWKSIDIAIKQMNKSVLCLIDVVLHSGGIKKELSEVLYAVRNVFIVLINNAGFVTRNSSWIVQFVDAKVVRGFLVALYGCCTELGIARFAFLIK